MIRAGLSLSAGPRRKGLPSLGAAASSCSRMRVGHCSCREKTVHSEAKHGFWRNGRAQTGRGTPPTVGINLRHSAELCQFCSTESFRALGHMYLGVSLPINALLSRFSRAAPAQNLSDGRRRVLGCGVDTTWVPRGYPFSSNLRWRCTWAVRRNRQIVNTSIVPTGA
jgi:hypothetical protein